MVLTILAITVFQIYWLRKAYEREERSLERQTNILFRETVGALQVTKFKLDKIIDTAGNGKLVVFSDKPHLVKPPSENHRVVSMMNVMMQKMRDSFPGTLIIKETRNDSVVRYRKAHPGKKDRLIQFMFDADSLQDSIKVKELHAAFEKRLEEQNLDVPFTIEAERAVPGEPFRERWKDIREQAYNEVTVGFQNPITYSLHLGNTTWFLFRRIGMPLLFSVFLVGFTVLSFTLLYRNLRKQQRLADIKNEFISNITHELKTPIATVSVAIEALRSFNASMDPERTREYLDISANELQRLSLLVDKVLKLSMFEKKEVELKYEPIDMKALVDEVTASMRLQFEKNQAVVRVHAEGNTMVEGDRLHLVSVIFNLLDNALKYSGELPVVTISIDGSGDQLVLSVADSGIGIPPEYQTRVFEKFFRVPTGNLHNAKGYGLGLSYVAHVVARHKGTIRLESQEGVGSRFIISLPRHPH